MSGTRSEPIRPQMVIAVKDAQCDFAALASRCSAVELLANLHEAMADWEAMRSQLATKRLTCAGLTVDPDHSNLEAEDARIRSRSRERILHAIHQASAIGASYVRMTAAK